MKLAVILFYFFCDLARLSNIHKEGGVKFGYRSDIKVKKIAEFFYSLATCWNLL
jgi:hypothetical protein